MTKNINPFEILPKLALGSTQLVNAAGITSRQLRYWESQGYIQSLPEKANNARQYSLSTALNVMAIKQGLDTGLPLATAVANTKTIINQINYLGRLINETYQGYQATTDQVRLNFGPVADQPDQQVTGVLTANDAYFKLTPRGQ
ncbi:MerR family transcriptional regulator [Lactobacillus coryniformis subsp. coryniformis KCTC 3167 = DSM] [Lactiplantibacillus mudanjiangensis]|uniref:MerR family transcriptional regulator n=1 Tax=Lactiplantibacillus mudanjiangensis TaxID=1296538 RepID=UPI0010155BF6|nr:MerR family transcriptional regulator [Lactiplantibacillus mudanjiangensis]VDG33705.1 MerR family transcriptional regulator [Lactobacillus coryniformis subsp. coryniformis KCTC 3167 = DSM] [Lactiplantibacillus mudanjiangensis]